MAYPSQEPSQPDILALDSFDSSDSPGVNSSALDNLQASGVGPDSWIVGSQTVDSQTAGSQTEAGQLMCCLYGKVDLKAGKF